MSKLNREKKRERDEHPFAQYVRILGKGRRGSRSLTEEESMEAMTMILRGEVEDVQLGAFLMLMRVNDVTASELTGFVRAAHAVFDVPKDLTADLDWSSYAGKRRQPPWFLLSALLLSKMGIRVFMHGASGHTIGRLYTEDTLKALGLPICQSWDDVDEHLNQRCFAYLPLRQFSKVLYDIIELRKLLGVRSPVHSMARLLNPLNAPSVIQGIFHPAYNDIHQQASQSLAYENVLVIKGEGGEIERNPDNEVTAYLVKQGADLSEEKWPRLFQKRHVKPENISPEGLLALWNGDVHDEYGEMAVIGTMALALKQVKSLESQEEALDMARQAWKGRNKDSLSC